MQNKEHKLQVECVKWFRYAYPQYRDLLFAIPNGGLRNKKVAKKLKAEGVVPGVPDLFLAVSKSYRIPISLGRFIDVPNNDDTNYHGLFIEMKVNPNKLTENQKRVIPKLESQNYACEVCYSFDEFKEIIESYLK